MKAKKQETDIIACAMHFYRQQSKSIELVISKNIKEIGIF
jgi:hypothetical protein